jgi:hypothetical protein
MLTFSAALFFCAGRAYVPEISDLVAAHPAIKRAIATQHTIPPRSDLILRLTERSMADLLPIANRNS